MGGGGGGVGKTGAYIYIYILNCWFQLNLQNAHASRTGWNVKLTSFEARC